MYLSVFNTNAGKYGPEKLRIRALFKQYQSENSREEEDLTEIFHYAVTQSSGPPAIDFYLDEDKSKLLYQSLLKNIAWSVANGLPSKHEENLLLLGSWTAFRRIVSKKEYEKSLIEYVPIISLPPK